MGKRLHSFQKQRSARGIIPWWYIIIGIDLFLVVVSILYYELPGSKIRYLIISPFNLGEEMNLAVWWSGVTLTIISLLSLEIFSCKNDSTRTAWLALSILFMILSIDEAGSLHERVREFGWIAFLPFALICFSLLSYALFQFLRNPDTRKTVILFIAAFFLYGSVAVQERIEEITRFTHNWAFGLRTGLEEGTELLGTFLLLYAIVPQRKIKTISFKAIIPRPQNIKFVPILVLLGLCIHVMLAIILPNLMKPGEIGGSSKVGDPLVWYPMALFFILSTCLYWESLYSKNERYYWRMLSVLFILSSFQMMFNLLGFFPVISALIPRKAVQYSLALAAIVLLSFLLKKSTSFVSQKTAIINIIFSFLVIAVSVALWFKMHRFIYSIWTSTLSVYAAFLFCAIYYGLGLGTRFRLRATE